jgi:hypothetical protein
LHSRQEQGISFYHDIIRKDVAKHLELEAKAKLLIFPARIEKLICKERAICDAVDGEEDLLGKWPLYARMAN